MVSPPHADRQWLAVSGRILQSGHRVDSAVPKLLAVAHPPTLVGWCGAKASGQNAGNKSSKSHGGQSQNILP